MLGLPLEEKWSSLTDSMASPKAAATARVHLFSPISFASRIVVWASLMLAFFQISCRAFVFPPHQYGGAGALSWKGVAALSMKGFEGKYSSWKDKRSYKRNVEKNQGDDLSMRSNGSDTSMVGSAPTDAPQLKDSRSSVSSATASVHWALWTELVMHMRQERLQLVLNYQHIVVRNESSEPVLHRPIQTFLATSSAQRINDSMATHGDKLEQELTKSIRGSRKIQSFM
ncbi:hypothetical protein B484DRAFT_216462 [Ochromonadaceae sp. CCMP2298]|nr:hypothetical protein B484DRAFT_233673 [Ochromonadaceae sp. CCMP2298]KAJ1438203.1 hypothetical protein B484DRAFT_216462 [Ochromonadaceae sp. CCMP2298]|mmetsp:Transcript_27131/g.60009  ORF Transcript_27131/g.60009 Transcript_27131/m.60009 type:complete len:228 (+) Transcript_27131:72-755(+)